MVSFTPNATFGMGILLGIFIISLPLALLLVQTYKHKPFDLHPVRIFFGALGVLTFFIMGAIVSTKIGGGADLHNMDVYLVLLLLVSLYFI